MMHHKKNRKFGRERNQRKALVKSRVSSLILKQKIKTTEAKAKEIRPYVEKLITRGKNDTLSNRRMIASRLGSETVGKTLIEKVSPKYKDRQGGYVRIVKLPRRQSDGSKMAIIELV